MVHPSVDVVLKALQGATDVKKEEGKKEEKKEEKKDAAPKAATLFQAGLEESVVLQVNGAPVFVNPESMIRADTEAATHLGLNDIKLGADEVSFSQKQMTPEELKEINEMQQRLA